MTKQASSRYLSMRNGCQAVIFSKDVTFSSSCVVHIFMTCILPFKSVVVIKLFERPFRKKGRLTNPLYYCNQREIVAGQSMDEQMSLPCIIVGGTSSVQNQTSRCSGICHLHVSCKNTSTGCACAQMSWPLWLCSMHG